jgi:hypothetical protein
MEPYASALCITYLDTFSVLQQVKLQFYNKLPEFIKLFEVDNAKIEVPMAVTVQYGTEKYADRSACYLLLPILCLAHCFDSEDGGSMFL